MSFLPQMVHIGNKIYCRQDSFSSALQAKSCSEMARKLLIGVITTTALLECTYSGQSVRTQGVQRMRIKMRPLHNRAKNTIIGKHTFSKLSVNNLLATTK